MPEIPEVEHWTKVLVVREPLVPAQVKFVGLRWYSDEALAFHLLEYQRHLADKRETIFFFFFKHKNNKKYLFKWIHMYFNFK